MDAYAWLEYLDGSVRGEKVKEILENTQNSIITSPITLAEVLSKFLRRGKDPKHAISALESNSAVPEVGPTLARAAGEVHAEARKRHSDFGLADAFVLATARSKSAKVVTGDPHFKGLPETVMI